MKCNREFITNRPSSVETATRNGGKLFQGRSPMGQPLLVGNSLRVGKFDEKLLRVSATGIRSLRTPHHHRFLGYKSLIVNGHPSARQPGTVPCSPETVAVSYMHFGGLRGVPQCSDKLKSRLRSIGTDHNNAVSHRRAEDPLDAYSSSLTMSL